MGELLTVRQVAERLQYNRETIIKLIKAGHLKASKLTWEYRIKEEDLEEFINSGMKVVDHGKED